ncbi:type I-E CRISPR-associated protein Cse2/CasB [Streptomyces sp. DSM 44917]|uniref:Type I-E CRISPR-associated protein Cse2/CasB n=1 Tax=Streptomyces boetiae TaxID=3075541 RepID=A0ABU2LDK4_9ACTN|nr:type I-E CRISPR-associated protein Cse2/CasB [Streptomyces sp. DSM 44917]MDT0309651.1 type I-E CRISPR-associated protein Cse2/CasB [Streptomyces sp. DSM 44917]
MAPNDPGGAGRFPADTEPAPSAARASAGPARRYWSVRIDQDGGWRIDPRSRRPMEAPGEHLAAMRSGLGRAAGTVPALWEHYTSLNPDGRVTTELEAEHAALALFGLHQQSQRLPMHRPRVSPGAALRSLHRSGRFSEEAVDRRVHAAANATSVPAFLYRLRGLITQLRDIAQPLDYDRLLSDIRDWHYPDSRQRVRRAWGLAYTAWAAVPDKDAPGDGASGRGTPAKGPGATSA